MRRWHAATPQLHRRPVQIVEAEARLVEAKASLERARPLVKSQYLSESVFDQRESAANMAAAQVVTARGALKSAEAEKAQVEAQRRELDWRRGNTEVRAPADGIVSRRNVRIGSIANGGSLERRRAPVPHGRQRRDRARCRAVRNPHGQHPRSARKPRSKSPAPARSKAPCASSRPRSTRRHASARVRVFLGSRSDLRVGAFARGTIETGHAHNISVPQSAILYDEEGHATVQIVEAGHIVKRPIETGLAAGNQVEVKKVSPRAISSSPRPAHSCAKATPCVRPSPHRK